MAPLVTAQQRRSEALQRGGQQQGASGGQVRGERGMAIVVASAWVARPYRCGVAGARSAWVRASDAWGAETGWA
jgi:hypothetical protein